MEERKGEATKDVILTFIIATYNAAKHITECLRSVYQNVSVPYEVVVVDGESDDDTLTILKAFNFEHLKILSERDNGIYDAMNKGTKLAAGKWILFLGADDRILPSFKNIGAYLTDNDCIYYGNCKNQNHLLGGAFSNYKLSKMNLCHQAIIYPSTVFTQYSFSLNYPVFSDYLLNMQCWGDTRFSKKYLDVDISFYNMEGFSSVTPDPDFRQDKATLVRRHLGYWIYLRYMFRKFKESKNPESKFF